MKIGMNFFLWTTRLNQNHFPLFMELKSKGFDGVEIPISNYSAEEIKAIRSALESEGLNCTATTILTSEANPISGDPGIRQAAVEQLRKDIEVAAGLGAETLAGPIHSAHKCFPGRGPNEVEFDRCVEYLKKVGADAQAADVALSIEPLNRFECYFLNLQSQGKKLADAVNLDSVGILYDTHHTLIEENNIEEAVKVLDNRMNHFHVSESHRGTPGTGLVDWNANFRALKEIGYNGWIVIEAFATDVDGIPNAVNIWHNNFSSKTEVYEKGIQLIKSHICK